MVSTNLDESIMASDTRGKLMEMGFDAGSVEQAVAVHPSPCSSSQLV
jgi:Fe2+ transport system protein FeoA